MKTPTEKFRDAAKAFIPTIWTKTVNPLHKPYAARYPASVMHPVHVVIDGKKKLFRIRIEEFSMNPVAAKMFKAKVPSKALPSRDQMHAKVLSDLMEFDRFTKTKQGQKLLRSIK